MDRPRTKGQPVSPQRIQLSRAKGWRKPEGAVLVSRPSRWGNPFSVYRGNVAGPPWADARENWGRVVRPPGDLALYQSHSPAANAIPAAVDVFRTLMNVRQRDEATRMESWIAPLRGKDLGCWCPLDSPCHADVLLELANPERESP